MNDWTCRCLATLIQWIAAMLHTQLEKYKLEGSVFSGPK